MAININTPPTADSYATAKADSTKAGQLNFVVLQIANGRPSAKTLLLGRYQTCRALIYGMRILRPTDGDPFQPTPDDFYGLMDVASVTALTREAVMIKTIVNFSWPGTINDDVPILPDSVFAA